MGILPKSQLEEKTDEELVGLILQDSDYFVYIMNRYESKLIAFIRRISGVNIQDAEDALQEVFIKVYKNLNSYDSNLKFSSWIYRIARNHVISEFRKKKSRGEVFLIDEEWNTFVSELNIENELDQKFDKELIRVALQKLNPKYREVLILKFLEERDYNEISDILKMPIGTVGTIINRGKKKLAQELKKKKIKL